MNNILEKKALQKHLKLPFLKIKLDYNKKNSLEKKLDITLDEIYKQTGTLITRINNYSSQFSKIGTTKYNVLTPDSLKNSSQNYNKINRLYYPFSQDSKKVNKLKLTKTKEFHFNSMNDILRLRLNKYKYNKKGKNKINFSQTPSLSLYPTHEKIKKFNNINYNLYDNNNNFEITISTNEKDQKENLEKLIIKKVPKINLSERNINSKTMDKMYKIDSILNDTNKNFHNINYNLINLYQNKKNTTLNNLKNIPIKGVNTNENNLQNITIENDKINYHELFEPIKELLNKPLKLIKLDNSKKEKNKFIWMKRSTANLLAFGQVSQSMHDDVFYKERKRIVESYPLYEKDADIDVKEKKKKFYSPNAKLKTYLKKVDNLINMNETLMKNINNKK